MLNIVCRSLLTVNVIRFQPTRSLVTAAARLTSHQPFRDVYRPADCVSVAGVLAKTHLNNPFLITRSLRYSAARTAVGNKADETKSRYDATESEAEKSEVHKHNLNFLMLDLIFFYVS